MNTVMRILSLLLIAGVSVINPAHAASIDALSEMGVSNLQFSSSDSQAVLFWSDIWFGEALAGAGDSDSGLTDDIDALFGNNGAIDAIADTAHVHSEAHYGVDNGDRVALDSSGQIAANAHSDLLLAEPDKQGDGIAIADFDNFFFVTGGTPGEGVEVTFTLDYEGGMEATADLESYFQAELAALIQLWEIDFFRIPESLLAEDLVEGFTEGTGWSVAQGYLGTLSVTTELLYGREYWLYAGAVAVSFGTTPIPGTLALFLFGIVASFTAPRRYFTFWKILHGKKIFSRRAQRGRRISEK